MPEPLNADAEAAQAPMIASLVNALSCGGAREVKRIDTQGAVVLLAGGDALKIRRAIRLPFLDYSTLARRKTATEREVALNCGAAPGVYLGAMAIRRIGDGFGWEGDGEIVDYATRMRRFDETATLDRLAERAELPPQAMDRLARAVHAMHEQAPRAEAAPALAAMEDWLGQNSAFFAARPQLFAPSRAQDLDAKTRARLAALRPLIAARGDAGFIRRGHGDLHLRNIAWIDGQPVPFDAIEFDDAIATGDVLYDLAFALMDLWERGFRPEANRLMNAYLQRGEEAHYAALAALPLYLSLRAAIRAKVEAANLGHLEGAAQAEAVAAARRYFDFALRFLEDRPTRLLAIGGLSGTGKSALAGALAPKLGRAPGAVWLRSDIERKHYFGVDETAALPEAAYRPEVSREIYARIERRAGLTLRAGHSAVLDAVHGRAEARQQARRIALDARAQFDGLWLDADLQTRLARVGARRGDASDADAGVAAAQSAEPLREAGWSPLDAGGEAEDVARAAARTLGLSDSDEDDVSWRGTPIAAPG